MRIEYLTSVITMEKITRLWVIFFAFFCQPIFQYAVKSLVYQRFDSY